MEFIPLFLIAIGLSFDTFAVSVSTGLSLPSIRFWQAYKIAFILAVFQGLMPFFGWFLGTQIANYIGEYDHWIAFGLLSLLGFKMIFESFKPNEENDSLNPLKPMVIIGMAIATSMDALVVGVSFAFLKINIYWAILIIGFVTFMVSMIGMLFGKNLGHLFGKKMEIIGGLILIGIGTKILIEHLF